MAGCALAAGCGRDAPRPDSGGAAGGPHGTALVVGSSAGEWGLLALPRDGGQASLRLLETPAEVIWEGATRLPAFVEAHFLDGAAVALRDGDGRIFRYDVARDALEELGRIGPEGVTWTASDRGGVFVSRTGDLFAVTPDRAWRDALGEGLLWAGAVDEGVAILTAGPGDEAAFRVVPYAGEAGQAATFAVAPPAVVTAWGRRVAFAETPGGRSLVVLTVSPPERAGAAGLDGTITAVAASPSSHELYAGLSDPPSVEAVNRFSFSSRRIARLAAPPVEIRPSLFGESLLVSDGERTWSLSLGAGDLRPVPGTWSADLPIGLPGDRVLARGESTLLLSGPGSAEEALAAESAPAGAWWLAVRWRPVLRSAAAEVEPQPVEVPAGRPARAGDGADARAADAEPEAGPGDEQVPAAGPPDVPPGYYAIVGSARQRDGIDALLGELRVAGFPVRVQPVTDEAGSLWFRGLVGPFGTRSEADAAARQLQRERQLQSWVTGIGSDGGN